MSDEWEQILNEMQTEKQPAEPPVGASTPEQAAQERREKVANFRLNLDLEDEFAPSEPTPAPTQPVPASADTMARTQVVEMPPEKVSAVADAFAQSDETPAPSTPVASAEPKKPQPAPIAPDAKKRKKKKAVDPQRAAMWGCFRSILYVALVLAVSLTLAVVIILAGLDVTGLNKSTEDVEVTIPRNASTREIAEELEKQNIIDHASLFIAFSKLTHADGTYLPGKFKLNAHMGYSNIIETLQAGVKRETVRVTIPEGYTIDKIAALLADKGVCTADEFYTAVTTGDYTDYDFIAAIPKDSERLQGRTYLLEGYLFPDTYEFYTGSSGETAVRKLLDGFATRVNTTYRAKIAAKGMTIDDAVILASIIQGEAADGEWSKVGRVLRNRLDNPSQYPMLQCDATANYIKNLNTAPLGDTVNADAYDTTKRTGLPAGAINNPGLNAFNAVLNPSSDSTVVKCYFFATDYESGVTYYSKTYTEHVNICRKYGIGMYAN